MQHLEPGAAGDARPGALPAPRRWPRRAAVAVAVVAALAVAGPFALRSVGRWLVVDEPLQVADAIFVHAGTPPFREIEAAELFRRGLAPEVWLSPTVMSAESAALAKVLPELPLGIRLRRAVLVARGVPPGALVSLDSAPASTTRDELQSVLRTAGRRGLGRVVLVTSRAHSRRVRVLWNRIAAGAGIQAIVHPAASDPFDTDAWWTNTDDAQQVLHEIFGLVDALWNTGIRPRS